ncbi:MULTISPECIES: cytochrome P450 [Prauserella salsuginis group]|uniref:Cytochrome P450 n=2 Tax=Prauserella salsuginis group TaxID=2893672 RepID=A0A839XPF3_9PSEU|nr:MULTISPECIES: cytochrome P450 [Prauserella salsuginis group]MBB3662563.1 cytochrome P450 [Prauserella sediminis]MCR3720271.1 Cytochrome P450 [Prauserella flava]MCR3734021.1 Cytochrome P450 [Prauserella salsuginis]
MFDPADPAFLADPYPEFARLRRTGGVHHHDGLGLAVAVSHEAASAVLRNRSLGRIWTDATPLEQFASFNMLHRNSLLENEPPAHTRLRRLVQSAFARGHVERLRPTVQALAARMVDTLATAIREDGEADLLEHLAQPLPVAVIAELLGIPEEAGPQLVEWSNAIVKMYEYGLPDDKRAEAERAAEAFAGHLRGLVDERAASPGDDLLSHLAVGELTGDEAVATAVLLLMAGHEATVNVIGNGVRALLAHRDQWDLLVADPGLADTATEELIRFDSPLQLFERTATADVEIAGFAVPEGGKIAALLGAAARDPEVFEEPDRLDITREKNPHLGFGGGIHYCLGAPLARIEIAAALEALVTRLPELRFAREPQRRAEFVIRGLRDFPVTVPAA